MIAVLAQTWELFGDALCTGLLLAMVLPLLGIVLVLRQQMFLAAAIGQSANCGLAVAIWAGLGGHAAVGHAHGESLGLLVGLGFAVASAVLSLRALSLGGTSPEARAVWMFLCGGSAAMLLLAEAPHGLQEVQRLMLSSLLGASPADVWIAAGLLLVSVAALQRYRRRLLLWAIDPLTAQVHGTSVGWLDVLVGCWLGLALGFAIHATGLVFTFGTTILPVLVAREVAPSLRAVLWSAPAVGGLAYALAFWLGDRFDLPPGQCTVAVLGAAALLARVVCRRR